MLRHLRATVARRTVVWFGCSLVAGSTIASADPDPPTVATGPASTLTPAERTSLEAQLMSSVSAAATQAAAALANAGSIESRPALRVALARSPTTAGRGAAARALGALNDLDSVPAMLELLRHEDASLAVDADAALASMTGMGRVITASMPMDRRAAIADRYANWWKGAESGLRARARRPTRKASVTTPTESAPDLVPPPPPDAGALKPAVPIIPPQIPDAPAPQPVPAPAPAPDPGYVLIPAHYEVHTEVVYEEPIYRDRLVRDYAPRCVPIYENVHIPVYSEPHAPNADGTTRDRLPDRIERRKVGERTEWVFVGTHVERDVVRPGGTREVTRQVWVPDQYVATAPAAPDRGR